MDKLRVIAKPYEFKDEQTGELITGNSYFIVNEHGYEVKVKFTKNDKLVLGLK